MNLPRMLIFNERSVRTLEIKLEEVFRLKWISWQFTSEDTLIVTGFHQPITFTHWKAAHAFLDGYLIGYSDCDHELESDWEQEAYFARAD